MLRTDHFDMLCQLIQKHPILADWSNTLDEGLRKIERMDLVERLKEFIDKG